MQQIQQPMYWWIIAHKDGKKFIVGPYESDVDAHEAGKRTQGVYSVKELPTRDENRATRMIKAMWMSPDKVNHVTS